MTDKDLARKYQILKTDLAETKTRIRRYSLDPRLKERQGENDNGLRQMADAAWNEWIAVRDAFTALPASPTLEDLNRVDKSWLELERKIDLIQRELISEKSAEAGTRTVFCLVFAMVVLIFTYLVSHGVRGWDLTTFEPWPEWGPMKYAEVAFWSSFGVLCYLLFLATYYLTRRDFDTWYQTWYISTAIRAPFLTVILMMIVLEFVEWYGEGTWMQTYLLEEGNKFYFIVFVSFCLGLTSDSTAGIIRDLSEGVTEFLQRAVSRVSEKLSLAVSKTDLSDR